MSETSWQVKKKYNQKTYGRITADLPKQLVEDFKAKCADEGVSVASVIKSFIEQYLEK